MRAIRTISLGLLALALPLVAQAQKRALTQADWDKWRTISGAVISNDGRWVVYTLAPSVGDGELVARATQSSTEYRVPRGYIGRANNIPGGLRGPAGGTGEGDPQGAQVAAAQITADNKFVLVTTQPTRAEVERQPRGRGGRAAPTRTALAILSLADGKVTTIPSVRSFRLPRDAGGWVAYVPEADSASRDSTAGGAANGRGGRGGAGGGARRSYGSPLVLRNLATGAEEPMADVLAYAFDDSAKTFAYTVVSRDSTKDGAFARHLATARSASLLTGRGDYKAMTFDRAGSQLVFLSNRDEFSRPNARFTMYYAKIDGMGLDAVVKPSTVPAGLHIADNAAVAFTRNGNAIVFNVAPPAIDSVPADSLVDKSVFDLWHYKDATLQPAQKLTAARDRNRSFQAIYFPATKKLVQLANDSIPSVNLNDDARVGVASSRERYMVEAMWGDDGFDVYVVDPLTGSKKLIREKINGQAQLSPDAKYVTMFDKSHWYAYNTATGRTVDLNVKSVSFAQETWDTPSEPSAWGLAGWTKGDRSVLLYDRFDVWDVDPSGVRPAVVVTDSLGWKQHTVLRLAEGGGGGRGGRGGGGGGADRGVIDPAEPIMLRAFDEETKASGFYRDQVGVTKQPEKIVMADVAFGQPVKAANADQWMVTKGTFVDFPNIYVGPSLTQLTRVSDANPQQKDYNWGTVELVQWTSTDGFPLKGLLYKPENFDPNKKYPMVSYFYEQLSQGRHNYIPPSGRNVINPTHYVSNGYLVFEPDIHYEIGYPGPSAMKSIVPGVQMLLARGYVDPKGLGLQGQSWGGYQTLYMITQSHMFNAAMAGAPVVNMTSAYGGIRWGSGLARSFQYEKTQSRIGKSIWEAPMQFFENSPLFWLDKVTTPLFIMSNDMDDAVPWYQGIETFVAMRRLGKEVYMINYNNDVHNPASRANQKDVAMRMQQFFDNKLKGAPAPDWMVKGIPFVAKGKDQLAPPAVQAGTQVPQPKP
jgi:dipeptidyl aminopeptidase/acylaminoacyl peptidase